jgi:hypothetical protein
MPELKDLTGAQAGVWLACLWFAIGLFNSLADAWGKLSGRDHHRLPDPLHTQEVTHYATEVDIKRVEERVRHLEEANVALIAQLTRDKSEIMEAAARGRNHINEQIAQLAAVCNRTAGSVAELSQQIATLFNSALRKKD